MKGLALIFLCFTSHFSAYCQHVDYSDLCKYAAFINKLLPHSQPGFVKVNTGYLYPMTMDSSYAIPRDTLVFTFTIHGANKNTPAMIDFKEKYGSFYAKDIAEYKYIRALLDSRVVFVYKYYFANEEYFISLYIGPDKYLSLIPD